MWSPLGVPRKRASESISATGIQRKIASCFFRFFQVPGLGWRNPQVLQAPRAAGVVPPRGPQKGASESISAKGIHSKIAPPIFLVFRVPGGDRSNPQVLQAPRAPGVVPPTRPKKYLKKQFWQKEFIAKSHPRIF